MGFGCRFVIVRLREVRWENDEPGGIVPWGTSSLPGLPPSLKLRRPSVLAGPAEPWRRRDPATDPLRKMLLAKSDGYAGHPR